MDVDFTGAGSSTKTRTMEDERSGQDWPPLDEVRAKSPAEIL